MPVITPTYSERELKETIERTKGATFTDDYAPYIWARFAKVLVTELEKQYAEVERLKEKANDN